jgi:hypothetical protein
VTEEDEERRGRETEKGKKLLVGEIGEKGKPPLSFSFGS